MSNFISLHNHTVYSPLDGCCTPREYFEECANRKYVAHAITEHGNMASVPDAYWASQEFGIKYIPGCEVYYCDQEFKRIELEKKGIKAKDIENEIDRDRIYKHRHLTILCKTTIGYQNLLNIKKESNNYFFRKARTNIKLLHENKEDLMVLSGCMNGPISFELRNYISTGDKKYRDKAIFVAKIFKSVFNDDFYIELQMPGVEDDSKLFYELYNIADELKIKPVLTNDCHFIKEEDYNLQKIMMSIDQGLTFDDPNLFISKSRSGYFKNREELRHTFLNGHMVGDEKFPSYDINGLGLGEFEIMCNTTLEIADKFIEFNPDMSTKLPKMDNEKNELWKLVCQGLIDKGLGDKKEYKERAKFEMDRIIEKEFCSYFLICRDLIRKSTVDLGMPVGPRGSAAGSLVCYLIGIHDIDPMIWSLSFDRFLSSSRGGKMLNVSMEKDEIIQGEDIK